MFAPHCPTCARRVLLGPRRLVGIGGHLWLRCHCDTLLDWDQGPEAGDAPTAVAGATDHLRVLFSTR